MKISIITVVWNNKETIRDAIDSVLSQTYIDIEYIVVDGLSTDGTIDVVRSYGARITHFLSESDKGLYDAMNKGIELSTGDVIGILNSDDFYIDEFVIEKVVSEFRAKGVDSVFGDLVYVKSSDLEHTVRYYDSSKFNPSMFAYGWMPAHPTVFIKRNIYEKYGVFRTDLKVAADFDILARFMATHGISYSYIQGIMVKMRIGGVSTSFSSIWLNSLEQLRVCADNNISTNILKILTKYFTKGPGIFKKK